MSNSVASTAAAPATAAGKNSRGDRKAAKGRRRRAAAEQRRIEQQRWGEYADDNDDEEDFSVVAPSLPVPRRRARRRNDRENLSTFAYGHHLSELNDEERDPDLALALALSSSVAEEDYLAVSSFNSAPQIERSRLSIIADMTYESLVQLEDVCCVASATVVAALPVCSFVREQVAVSEVSEDSEVCVICQGDYDHGDAQVKLPCLHDFHQACGAEWLLKYSKLCPVCKHDVTEVATEATPTSSL